MLLAATFAYFLFVQERYPLQYYVEWNPDFSNLQAKKKWFELPGVPGIGSKN